jgi:hypothetical protein
MRRQSENNHSWAGVSLLEKENQQKYTPKRVHSRRWVKACRSRAPEMDKTLVNQFISLDLLTISRIAAS